MREGCLSFTSNGSSHEKRGGMTIYHLRRHGKPALALIAVAMLIGTIMNLNRRVL